MLNGGCVEKETNYHFNCVKIRYLSSRFFRSFFPYTWKGQRNNRPLGSFDMNSPLETLVLEVIRTADKNTSRVEICTVCDYKNYPFFHRGSARKALMKRNTSSVVGFVVVLLHKYYQSLLLQQGRFQSRINLSSRTIYFPVASNHMKALGLR